MPRIAYKNAAGQRLSGVTTVIGGNLGWSKNGLMYWAWEQGRDGKDFRDTKQAAADAGTIAHTLIEADIKGITLDLTPYPADLLAKAQKCYENFHHWKSTVGFKPLKSELTLVSEFNQYGGTIDCIAEIQGKPCLFDWKSSNGVHEEYLIQLSAYQKVYEENFPAEKLSGAYLLRISKEDAAWTFHYWENLDFAWLDFIRLLGLHNSKKLYKGKV